MILRVSLLISTMVFAHHAGAEIIDRIAVSIDKNVITESEILNEIRLTAFLNGVKPAINLQTKREAADRLVEQTLIRSEIEFSRYTEPDPEAWMKLYEVFRKSRFPSDEAYQAALKEYGTTDEDVRRAFRWQRTLLEFVATRFRLGIQISDAELRDYFDTNVVTAAKEKNEKPPAFEDVRADIEEILSAERVDNALDRWLGQARTQSRIRYRPAVFSSS